MQTHKSRLIVITSTTLARQELHVTSTNAVSDKYRRKILLMHNTQYHNKHDPLPIKRRSLSVTKRSQIRLVSQGKWCEISIMRILKSRLIITSLPILASLLLGVALTSTNRQMCSSNITMTNIIQYADWKRKKLFSGKWVQKSGLCEANKLV